MFKLERNKIKTVNASGDVELKNGRIISRAYVVRNDPNRDDYIIAKEETGLLGLTNQEDDETPPVNKQAVVNYVHELVNKAIAEQTDLLKKAVSPAFFSNKSHARSVIKTKLTARELEILSLQDLLSLDEPQRNELINIIQAFRGKNKSFLFKEGESSFAEGIGALLRRGVTLQQFVKLDKDHQFIFALNGITICLLDKRIPFEKLEKLTLPDLQDVFSNLIPHGRLFDFVEGDLKLREEISKLIDSKLSQPSYTKNF
jgi:hypothetical protein